MTALQNKIVEIGRKDGVEDALIKGTALSVAYYGVENEVEEYMEAHPDATVVEIHTLPWSPEPPSGRQRFWRF